MATSPAFCVIIRREDKMVRRYSVRIGLCVGAALLAPFALTGGCGRKNMEAARLKAELGDDWKTAHRKFKTNLTPAPDYQADGPAPEPPNAALKLVRYPSDGESLAAYLTPNPGDGEKHPAVIWAHGGFGGIGETYWQKDEPQNPEALVKAGFVVLYPSWRGENDNLGQFELFFGEVDDALAAIEYVRKLPYVNANRVYFAGHSTGGTITLLTAAATDKVRAVFSFGGAPDIAQFLGGQNAGMAPFDPKNLRECYVRSPIVYAATLRVPVFYFEGEESAYPEGAADMARRATAAGKKMQAFTLRGGTHFSILRPLIPLIAEKIKADTGDACNISFTREEVQAAFNEY